MSTRSRSFNWPLRLVAGAALAFAAWLTFSTTKLAEADYPVQDRFFDGPNLCRCYDAGSNSFEWGCGFMCENSGNDCWRSKYCFCPC